MTTKTLCSMKFKYLIAFLITLFFTNLSNSQVVINEYSVSNLSQFPDNYQKYEDWFELYNTSTTSINIGGYYLSDRPGNPFKWQIPENTVISGNGFLRFWASGRNEASGNHYHTNFRLTQTKNNPDYVILSNPFGTAIDSQQLQITQLGHSRGRFPNGSDNWVIFTNPTPNTSNNSAQAYIGYAEKPEMSHQAGFYFNGQSVTISTNEPEVTIRYTTNGSTPTSNSAIYTNPINIDNTTLLQAKAFHSNPDILPSLVEFNTYFINESSTLPVLSISGDQLTQLLNGNASLRPKGTIEYFNANKVRTAIATGEFNEHGQDSWVHPQRSIDLITRDEMGHNYAVKEKLLTISERDEFQRIILRAAGDDNYPGIDSSAHMRDLWAQNMAEISGMSLDVRKGARILLFANGQFWGVYSIREKVSDHDFTKFYYNQDKYDLQFLMYWGGLWAQYGGQQAINDWLDLRTYILNNDMTNPFAFFYVDQLYDYKSLVDYVIINSFVVCSDWLNWNVGWWRGLNPDGTHQKWGYILWDEDAILGHYVNYTGIPGQHPYVSPCYPEYLSSYSDPQKHVEILKKLMYNPDFYQYYVSRYIDLLNTAFVKERLIASIDSIADVFRPEMPKHIERWGGNMTKWENNVQKLRNFISNRVDYVPSGLKSCYDLTGPFPITVNVEPAGSGIIRLNSLELGVFPWDANYFGNIDIKLEALTSKVEFEFDYWEISNHTPTPDTSSTTITLNLINNADITAHFKLKTYTDSLIINEINYKSATWFNTEDWIEFYNPHNYDLDISNWLFKDGNDNNSYFFPPNTIIAANGYLVLCKDTTAFKSLQPLVTNYLGNMDFGFSANGELLRLYNSEGLLIDTVHYGNDDPWPPEANGLGPTLELIKPSLDNAQPENWMASAANGTPGAMNSLIAEIKEKKNLKEKFAISVFPNPASENVYIWIHEENQIKNGLIQIYNSMGRKVFHKENIRSDKHEINVMDFPDGLYIVKFYDKGTELSASSKLIINRK